MTRFSDKRTSGGRAYRASIEQAGRVVDTMIVHAANPKKAKRLAKAASSAQGQVKVRLRRA